MSRKLEDLCSVAVIAIMRADSTDQLLAATDAILEGGVKAIEVTMTTPSALRVLEEAASKYGDSVLFGVGSVLDSETARVTILSGAKFVVCPTLNIRTIELCNRYSVPVIPGAYTPTEVLTAWESGADMVKVFPANTGGPSHIKAILAPLPQVNLVPVGGVNLKNAADYFQAGATAIGVGSALINRRLLDAGDLKEITKRAAGFMEIVRKSRLGQVL